MNADRLASSTFVKPMLTQRNGQPVTSANESRYKTIANASCVSRKESTCWFNVHVGKCKQQVDAYKSVRFSVKVEKQRPPERFGGSEEALIGWIQRIRPIAAPLSTPSQKHTSSLYFHPSWN